jgi:hypothetical protein
MAAGIKLAFYVAWVVLNFSKDWGWVANLSIFTAYEP